ncbi:hypothetical protein [Cupriavidus pinatubonensis]|uniref:hypothetical protein n=1 Tax=Cupriavidus pinatubonensis TaxID=248026 RepID=UPI001128A2F4|nr:hypothetical protein [Cupriavidus pinatubonensis]TPQ30672.1 hypothetical protein C2U69_30890 [Cupriavidus pinatubonensis]
MDQSNNLPSILSDDSREDTGAQLVQRARAVLTDRFDSAELGRIVQASREILLSQERIQTEQLTVGARLAQIHSTMVGNFEASLDNRRVARRHAAHLLLDYCKQVLNLGRSSMYVHMQTYRRFLDNNRAVNLFTFSELAMLARDKVSDDDLLMIMEEKEKNNALTRADIKKLMEKSRHSDEQLLETSAKLEGVRDELAQAVTHQRDMEFEIKHLRAQAHQASTDRDTHRAALSDAQVDLARSNNAVSKLQIAIDDLTHERDRLLEQAANAKLRVETKEVVREVPPVGYTTIEASIEAVNQRLATAKQELQDTLQRLETASTAVSSEADTRVLLEDLQEHFEVMAAKFSRAQLRVLMSQDAARFRPLLETMAAVVSRYNEELIAALNRPR